MYKSLVTITFEVEPQCYEKYTEILKRFQDEMAGILYEQMEVSEELECID